MAINCSETVIKKNTGQVVKAYQNHSSQEHTGRREHTQRGQEQYEHVGHHSTRDIHQFKSTPPKKIPGVIPLYLKDRWRLDGTMGEKMEELTLFANLCQIATGQQRQVLPESTPCQCIRQPSRQIMYNSPSMTRL